MNIRSIAVFCGSKEGNNKLYIDHAVEVGRILAENNVTLIYGGGGYGIMGAVATSALSGKGKVIGIMPKVLTDWEKHHREITELHEVDNMHSRKKLIYEKSDAALIMAGGYGTLDEMFEIITWNQLKIHTKKIILLNTAGFYDNLINHLYKMEEEGFLYDRVTDKLLIINHPVDLVPLFN